MVRDNLPLLTTDRERSDRSLGFSLVHHQRLCFINVELEVIEPTRVHKAVCQSQVLWCPHPEHILQQQSHSVNFFSQLENTLHGWINYIKVLLAGIRNKTNQPPSLRETSNMDSVANTTWHKRTISRMQQPLNYRHSVKMWLKSSWSKHDKAEDASKRFYHAEQCSTLTHSTRKYKKKKTRLRESWIHAEESYNPSCSLFLSQVFIQFQVMSNMQADLAGRLCFGSVIWLKAASRMSGASVCGHCWLRLSHSWHKALVTWTQSQESAIMRWC